MQRDKDTSTPVRSEKRPPRPVPLPDSPHRDPADLVRAREEITRLVVARAPEVVSDAIEQIKQGNYQMMKYLFEMVGLFPATVAPETRKDDSVARLLLNSLRIPADELSNLTRQNGPPGETSSLAP
jgi:hypothetical protein